ncbi:chromosome partitioning protein [Ectothiorhodospira magna]|uniref:Chromosome partitioning protein n=1 Tax=Ectothiorhodospira magna TaxID=867345 RepID=A0A1H9C5U8_9GAMM|nr:ParA family protein [Ectothiorhodospira magna]SEP96357.1 chromosome partitioning protein [Ectothiorhodospira magna]
MVRIIAVANQKGGVGKTTTSINLSACLAAARYRVLLIDLDPQGNATTGSGADKHALVQGACEVLMKRVDAGQAIMGLTPVGYDLMPANGDLTVAEVSLMTALRREYRLQEALAPIHDQYDFILIDCPPALNMLTVNALVAAQGVIIPMQCEYYALEGLSALVQTIESIRESVNRDLHIHGVLRTMFDPRNNLTNDVSAQLIHHFGDKVYHTVIPRNIRLAEAPSHGLPVMDYDRSSRGAQAYLALAEEMLRREGRRGASDQAGGTVSVSGEQ